MGRFLIVFFLFFIYTGLTAQETTVKKSSDIVVIKGKSYYLHVVEEGQTLFSICKAYGVDREEVKRLNGKHDDNISIFDVLKIPYKEPYVEKDEKYYYHQVQKGETLYSISRKFGIRVKRILRENKQYEKTPLGIGDVVKLPLSEIDKEAVVGTTRTEPVEKAKTDGDTEHWKQTLPEPVVADTIVVKVSEDVNPFETVEPEGKTDFEVDLSVPANKYVKVAVLLPLFIQENIDANSSFFLTDTSYVRQEKTQILHKSEQFIHFYEGILLAADSLKKAGYKIDLYTFDTQKSGAKMYELTEKINNLNPDLILGPVYASEYKVIAENLLNKNIPLIYPLSSRGEGFSQYPYFFQVTPSSASLADEMGNWIYKRLADSSNVVAVRAVQSVFTEENTLPDTNERNYFVDKLRQIPGINFYAWDFDEDQSEAFRLLLDPYQENIIVLPSTKEADIGKILPALSAYTDEFRITVVGFPEWQNFTSVDHDAFYKLNVKVFTYSYVDNYQEKSRDFAETYRKYFHTEPHTLTNKAYDMALYFIPLAAKFGERTREAIGVTDKDGLFSRFGFRRMCPECGWENRRLFIVNYSNDYTIKVSPMNEE